jgi:hypothetical protein
MLRIGLIVCLAFICLKFDFVVAVCIVIPKSPIPPIAPIALSKNNF